MTAVTLEEAQAKLPELIEDRATGTRGLSHAARVGRSGPGW